jgi:exodeoxyribonuclease V alpha subunit
MTLADLRVEQRIDALDQRFAEMLVRSAGTNELVAMAAALACQAPTRGDVGVDLRTVPNGEELRAALIEARSIVRTPDEARVTPLVLDGFDLYLERTWTYQERLIAMVHARLSEGSAGAGSVSPPPPPAGEVPRSGGGGGSDVIDQLFSGDPREDGQRAAVLAAATQHLTLIAGGPGTGKTAVVVKLLALMRDARILLAAPTGKAAARMTESIRDRAVDLPMHLRPTAPEATTLHRMLGTQWGKTDFRHDRDNPLPADLVIIDEASMIDLPMMCRLLDAVPPSARLVLLGDPNQLASVELGCVFSDLVKALGPRVSRLTHTWRYSPDSGIQALADALLAGDANRSLDVLARGGGDVGFGTLESANVVDQFVAVARADSPAEALRRLRSIRVLCAHRRGPQGVESINAQIESAVRARLGIRADLAWYPGRPVMITANDNEGKLYNGDLGVAFEGPDGLRVWLETASAGVRGVPPSVLPPNETAYASTVHKSQGSEFGHVVVVLPTEASAVVTRELLYTAATRAREQVTLVTEAEVWKTGVSGRVQRMSRVGVRLALVG